jgi:hypothetical protein
VADVHGVTFSDEIAQTVRDLIDRLAGICAPSAISTHDGWVRLSLRHPREQRNSRAYRLFFEVRPDGSEAVIRKPMPVKSGDRRVKVTTQNLEQLVRMGHDWFRQASNPKLPIEYQSTESKAVVAGGQFESNRRKH